MSVETIKDLEFLQIYEHMKVKCSNRLHLLGQDKNGTIFLRSNIKTLDEAASFIEQYQSLTHSRYKMCNQRKSSSGFLFQKEWNCHLAHTESCNSRISIGVKSLQKANDEFLRLSPPLRAVIKINRQHSHGIPSKIGKIPKEVCDSYYGYFNNGIKGIKAKRLHEENLRKRKVRAPDGSTMNPRMTAVYTLYKKWKQLKKNAEINKVPICNSGPHACSRIDTLIAEEIKVEPVDEEEEYDSPSNMSTEVPIKVEDTDEENDNCLNFDEIVIHQKEITVKIEDPNEEDNNCPDFNQIVIHQNEVMIEEIVEEANNCPNGGQIFSNSKENELKGMDKRGNYNSRIQKRLSHSKANQNFGKNRNKLKSPKIVNCCSLNTRSQNNAMPSSSVVSNSNSYYISSSSVVSNNNSYYISSSSVQTNNFVTIINPPPVPLITNMTNINTNVVCSVQRAVSINNSHLTLYNPSSNTYTVVQLCLPNSPTVSPSNLYSAHFPNGILSPTRVGINKF